MAPVTPRNQIEPGDKFNRLTVESVAGTASNGGRKWLCTCSCGGTKVVSTSELSSGDTQSCGCLQNERSRDNRLKCRTDLTGKQLGQTTGVVLGPSDQYIVRKNGNRALLWQCRCECGAEFLARGDKLQGGKLLHCSAHRRSNHKRIDYAAIRQTLQAPYGYKLVSKDDKTTITLAAGNGDKQAITLLLLMYEHFVYRMARDFAAMWQSVGEYDVEELAQECRCALLKSAETWNPDLGAAFTTWSAYSCRSYMQQSQNSGESIIEIPRSAYSRDTTRERAKHIRHVVSLDMPIDEDGDRSLSDVVGDNQPGQEENYANCELRELIRRSIDVLDDRDKTIITMRYLGENDTTCEEVAAHLGVSRARVGQLEERALRRLCNHVERMR